MIPDSSMVQVKQYFVKSFHLSIMFPFPFMPPMIGMKPQRKPKAAAPTNPQATLYVRNLNEKLKPSVISEALLTIFSQFGKVIDIKYKKHIRHRGQAFVSFETSEIATEAMIKSQGFPLFEKPMDIQYAREPSFAVTALKGKNTLANHKRNREEKVKTEPVKKPKMTQEDHLPPNRILFIQNLAPTVTSQVLVQMFSQYLGFYLGSLALEKFDWYLERRKSRLLNMNLKMIPFKQSNLFMDIVFLKTEK